MKNVPDSPFGVLICLCQASQGLDTPDDVNRNVCIFQMYINTDKNLYFRVGSNGWSPWRKL